jgi:hypothetical protein
MRRGARFMPSVQSPEQGFLRHVPCGAQGVVVWLWCCLLGVSWPAVLLIVSSDGHFWRSRKGMEGK